MNKKTRKKLKRKGDAESSIAFTYLSDGRTKIELAVLIGITLDEVGELEHHSIMFKRSVTMGLEAALAKDLGKLRKQAQGKNSTPTTQKIYWSTAHSIGDKPVIDDKIDDNEEFGFDITVRKK